ncbi:hypothetical protein BKA65DRAFT_471497 [Rhexocercosporidium sp. MPI-PUGE-AT-0058]|nr:hypothetical protein BKA65DRAFT_471497 [Rhexocercosporidium sp. MPI-PUGE-AT-0058]
MSASVTLTSTLERRELPELPNEDEEGSRELVSDSDPEDLRADDTCSKRRKVSTPQGRRIVSRNTLSPASPLVLDNDEDSEEDDGALSISLDARLIRFSRSTPTAKITSPTELEVRPVVTDVDQDWDVREITGKEDLDGVSYYLVDWHPTLLPKHSLGHAKELVDKFEVRI